MIAYALRALVLTAILAAPGFAEDAIRVADGDYRIVLPDGPMRGVYIFLHGYQSSADLTLRDQRPLVEVALAHGLAFVAVDGKEGTWSIAHSPASGRDEPAFIGEILDDLAARYGVTAANTLIGGFSQGASAAWYAVCAEGGRFAGMVTFSGVF